MILIVCIAIVGATVWFLLWYDKKLKNTDESKKSGSGSSVKSEFPLKVGSRGELVKELQRKLNSAVLKSWDVLYVKPTFMGQIMKTIAVDGIFGPKTLTFLQYVFVDTSKTEISESEFNNLK